MFAFVALGGRDAEGVGSISKLEVVVAFADDRTEVLGGSMVTTALEVATGVVELTVVASDWEGGDPVEDIDDELDENGEGDNDERGEEKATVELFNPAMDEEGDAGEIELLLRSSLKRVGASDSCEV